MASKNTPSPSDAYSFTYEHAQPNFRDTWRIFRIMAEFVEGYQFLNSIDRGVTVYGSARLKPANKWYKEAVIMGELLTKADYTVITGGGPGIMEAANKGAYDAGGESVGLNIQLPFEQQVNPYVKKSTPFYYFFVRKVMLMSPSRAHIFFPGGFGTFDEFFEVMDNIALGKAEDLPVVCVGKAYWDPLFVFLKEQAVERLGTISADVLDKVHVVDSAKEAMAILKKYKAPKNVCTLTPSAFACDSNINWRVFRIMSELVDGFEFLTNIKDDVTVLGGRGVQSDTHYYEAAYTIGRRLAKKNFTVVSGGAGGIMEGVSKGVVDGGGSPIGIGMKVGGKEEVNKYVSEVIGFDFPSIRKVVLTAPSKLFVTFPGGLGTMHELFELLTLEQTGKMGKIPIVLYDNEYWGGLKDFVQEIMFTKFKTISPEDCSLFTIVDSVPEVMTFAKKR